MPIRCNDHGLEVESWTTTTPEVVSYFSELTDALSGVPPEALDRVLVAGIVALTLTRTPPAVRRSLIPSQPKTPTTGPVPPDTVLPDVVLGKSGADLDDLARRFEDQLIDQAMERTKGNKQAAAALLRLKRTTLVAKLRRREDLGQP